MRGRSQAASDWVGRGDEDDHHHHHHHKEEDGGGGDGHKEEEEEEEEEDDDDDDDDGDDHKEKEDDDDDDDDDSGRCWGMGQRQSDRRKCPCLTACRSPKISRNLAGKGPTKPPPKMPPVPPLKERKIGICFRGKAREHKRERR
jgi:hypothetical protein